MGAYEDLQKARAELAREKAAREAAEAELTAGRTRHEPRPLTFKVSPKGAVSVYGLQRFPVTLYAEQWTRLLERAEDIRAFIDTHRDMLTTKGE